MSCRSISATVQIKKNFSETQICERLFFTSLLFLRLFELDDAEIVLVVDDDTVGLKLAGFTGTLP